MLPDTDVSLLLIQTPSSEVFQNRDTFLILTHSSMTYSSTNIPYGIYKPIPDKILSLLQMASLSPSLDGIFKPISDDFQSYIPDGIFKPIYGELPSSPPNGICRPIPDTTYTVQHNLRRVQI